MKNNEPAPDTGVSFGASTLPFLIAWGGTAPDDAEGGNGILHRGWFYDLSAGPEYWSGNHDITPVTFWIVPSGP